MSEAKLLGVVAVRFRLRGRDLARCYGQTGRREPALQGSGRISRSQRLLDDGDGDLIATSDAFQRRDEGNAVGPHAIAAFVALATNGGGGIASGREDGREMLALGLGDEVRPPGSIGGHRGALGQALALLTP